MDETREGKQLYELSDLDVDAVGLVYRGAVRKPFYFVKSEDGRKDMADELKETPVQETPPEPAANQEAFAEQMRQVQEDFAQKLEAERKEREKFSDLYQKERHTRRLSEFTERVRGYSFGAEVERFAEDLIKLEDLDPELHSRMLQRFNAIDEQMKSGELFAQLSKAGGDNEGKHPFELEVEKVRKAQFADKPYAEGFSEAMRIAERENVELARDYAMTH